MLLFLNRHLIQALINKAFPRHCTSLHETEIFTLLPIVGRGRTMPSMYTNTTYIYSPLSMVKYNIFNIKKHNITKKSNTTLNHDQRLHIRKENTSTHPGVF